MLHAHNIADVSVVSDVDTSNILLTESTIGLVLQVPHYPDDQSFNRTASLHLIQPATDMRQGLFLHPDVMTLHIIGECVSMCACIV